MKKTALLLLCLALSACKSKESGASPDPANSTAGTGTAASPAGAAAPAKIDRSAAAPFPGSDAGAKALLSSFLNASTDKKALTKALRPDSADYAAVFVGDASAKAEQEYAGLWGGDDMISGKEGQTELLLSSATTDDFKAWNDKADTFPGGYKKIVDKLKPGLVLYRWKFVRPGEKIGMAYDGLTFVNGHWAWFPKPWHALKVRE